MSKNPTKYTFLTPIDALGVLYLMTQEVLIVPHAIIDFPDLASLPFLDFIPGLNVTAYQFHNSKGRIFDNSQELSRLQYTYQIPHNGYAIVKNDKDAFDKFIDAYLAWYKEGLHISNSLNYATFHSSLYYIVEFLKALRKNYGNNFSILSENILEEQKKLAQQIRWQEILLYLHSIGSIKLLDINLTFPSGAFADTLSFLKIPRFNINLDVLTDLLAETDVRVEWCGVQILKDDRVRINNTIIPMRLHSMQWAFLTFLVEARGKTKTYRDVPITCIGNETSSMGKHYTSSAEDKIEQLKQAVFKSIRKVISNENIPFCIRCAPHKKDSKTGEIVGEFYIYPKKN